VRRAGGLGETAGFFFCFIISVFDHDTRYVYEHLPLLRMGCPRSQAVLDILATTDVGRTSGPPVADEEGDAASEASEWEARGQEKRAWERREEEER